MAYVSLHNHTEYSNIRLLDSINKVPEVIDKAVELDYKGVAITDHESLSGHIKAIKYVKEGKSKGKIPQDFKLILGNECYLIDDIDKYKNEYDKETMKYYHFIILAKNKDAYKILRQMSSQAWENSFNQRRMDRVPITYEQVEKFAAKATNNLVASTACLGSFFAQKVLQLLSGEDTQQEIEDFLKWGQRVFGKENFFIEVQPSKTSDEQKQYNLKAFEIGKHYNIPVIITTDSHYLTTSDKDIHAAYLNSKDGDREVSDFYSSTFMMSEEEIYDYMRENGFTDPEIKVMLDNTFLVYDMVEEFDMYHDPIVPSFDLPDFEIQHLLKDWYNKYEYIPKFAYSNEIQDRFLLYQIECGLMNKDIDYGETEVARINLELEELWLISEELHERLSSYYNTMKKIIDLIWEDGDSLVGTARGSVTGFFIAYLLDISQANPIKWNLPHWRHVNRYKKELADIDVDSEAMKRNSILQALKDFFGEQSVINICTFGTETTKSAILTAVRGMKINADVGLYLASMVPVERGFLWPIRDCLYGNEEKNRKPVGNLVKELSKYEGLTDIILRIEGLVNKRSIHASGVYIFNTHYSEYNAVMKAPNGQLITQYNMEDSDYCGGVKFDLLTIQALDKIRLTLDYLLKDGLIKDQGSLLKTYKKYLHPDVLDYDTPEMWDMIGQGVIPDLFQLETNVGSSAVRLVKPRNLVELATTNSLMRLMGGTNKQPLDEYKEYKDNINLWYEEMRLAQLTEQEVAVLEPHLKELYGVADTQEVVMEMVMDENIAGFTLTEADKLRKAIGKKSESVMKEVRKMFFDKGLAANTSQALLNYVWNIQIGRQLGYNTMPRYTAMYNLTHGEPINIGCVA